ncbi:MAG: FAD-dependent 5-carboxymethylaminomethyl-2-thiouridine(34) oxidoreductase MnmC [Pseudomonadota bacterium]|nr:FAD-dependent 5-carboxymethylaminomethyl-2-thiouridine(34) oxidoreductase MnmC [Pseudomonadota bacterium]
MTPGWAGLAHWRILALGAGGELRFLSTWKAWRDDPQRPRMLHFVAIVDEPVNGDLLPLAAGDPELQPLAQALARQWYGLLPGVHRLVFEQGHVLLTLCIGASEKMLRQLDFHADSVFLHEASVNLKSLARRCRRGTRIVVVDGTGAIGAALQRHGFLLHESDSALVCGIFAPSWEPRGAFPLQGPVTGNCIVVGAGLAGSAVAASLARRGWNVRVLEAGPAAASGASGLPAGVLVPHGSPDDNLLSRLSRDGVRATLQQAHELLRSGLDWEPSGVLEVHSEAPAQRKRVAADAGTVWSRPADGEQLQRAALASSAPADWHEQAAWIRPAALVDAWLATPGVSLRTGAKVASLSRDAGGWQALDASGTVLAQGALVIVAAAMESRQLLPGLSLQAVRGQVSWAPHAGPLQLPPFPVNGDGSFIPSVPTAAGPVWLCGAGFDRIDTDLAAREVDQQANLVRLQRLLPSVARQLAPAFADASAQAWIGIRCASTDRRPLAGPLDDRQSDGLWLSTAMGSRGLTFAALCGELIAARLHGEPLPLSQSLARALYPRRQKNPPAACAAART